MHPYQTLNVPIDADSESIRQAYLAAIRKHPPEVDPEAFRVVSHSFSKIDTEDKRLRREIGAEVAADDVFRSPFEAVAAFWKADLDRKPPAEAVFRAFLRS